MADTFSYNPINNLPQVAQANISNSSFERKKLLMAESASADTLQPSQPEEQPYVPLIAGRLELPRGTVPSNVDYLEEIAIAFSDAGRIMAQSTTDQVGSLANIETLDQSMSATVLHSINTSMKKEKASFKVEQKENKMLNAHKKRNEAFKITSWVVGAVLIAITVVSSVVDFGASAPLVPEEVEMMESGTSSALSSLSEDGDGEAMQMEEQGTQNNIEPDAVDEEISEEEMVDEENPNSKAPDYMKQTESMMKETNADAEARQTRMDALNDSDEAKPGEYKQYTKPPTAWGRASEALGNKWFLRAVGFTSSLVGAAPQFLQGYSQMKVSHYQKKYVVPSQKALGKASGNLQRLNYDFQFCQQLVQRQSGVAQQMTEQLSDVFAQSGDIFSAYRQISYGLAQAV